MTTSAPARASVSASARPRPRDPPVTKATRPERSISSAISQSPRGLKISFAITSRWICEVPS
jgi:hypothetical protein